MFNEAEHATIVAGAAGERQLDERLFSRSEAEIDVPLRSARKTSVPYGCCPAIGRLDMGMMGRTAFGPRKRKQTVAEPGWNENQEYMHQPSHHEAGGKG
jgi:hypothetical protein